MINKKNLNSTSLILSAETGKLHVDIQTKKFPVIPRDLKSGERLQYNAAMNRIVCIKEYIQKEKVQKEKEENPPFKKMKTSHFKDENKDSQMRKANTPFSENELDKDYIQQILPEVLKIIRRQI